MSDGADLLLRGCFWTSGPMIAPAGGAPFQQVLALDYNPSNQTLLIIYSGLGSTLITGPKAWDFYERFCAHMVALVKVDDKAS
jgi:hypothetical protein